MVSDDVVRENLERLVPLQESFFECVDRLNEARPIARSDGLNMEAINALILLLARYPHDRAAGVLNELIRYAEAFGAELAESHPRADKPLAQPSAEPQQPLPAAAETPPPEASRRRTRYVRRLRFATQLVLACSVTVGLLLLLS